jgi:hypothetical protein
MLGAGSSRREARGGAEDAQPLTQSETDGLAGFYLGRGDKMSGASSTVSHRDDGPESGGAG